MRRPRQPCLDLRRLVGRVVVHHQMNVWPVRHRSVDPFEEIQKLGCTVTFVALADHRACRDVERCEQWRRAIADTFLLRIRRSTSCRHAHPGRRRIARPLHQRQAAVVA